MGVYVHIFVICLTSFFLKPVVIRVNFKLSSAEHKNQSSIIRICEYKPPLN